MTVRNKRKVKQTEIKFKNFLQITHLQLTPSQFLITVLKDSRFFEDLMWKGKLFQIFGPNILKLVLPILKLVLQNSDVFRGYRNGTLG